MGGNGRHKQVEIQKSNGIMEWNGKNRTIILDYLETYEFWNNKQTRRTFHN